MAQGRLFEMDAKQDGTQAQGNAHDVSTETRVTDGMRNRAQGDMEKGGKRQATSHKRQDVLSTCGIIAVVAGIIMYLAASHGAYVDASGMLHESFALIVGSKALVIVGVAFVIAALVAHHRAGRGAGSGRNE